MMGLKHWWGWLLIFFGPAILVLTIGVTLPFLFNLQTIIVVGIGICCFILLIWKVKKRLQNKEDYTQAEQ